MALLPMAMYGLEVPPGDMPMMAHADIPASFRVTMAAIDPSADPEGDEDEVSHPRATLKVMRIPLGEDLSDEDSGSDIDMDDMDAKFGDVEDLEDDSDSSDNEDVNGGPSDPTKSNKAKAKAAIAKLLKDEGMDIDSDDDEDIPNGVNGIAKSKKAKGKMPAGEDEDEDESEIDSDDEGGEIEEFVICTLDPNKNYQQPLDITFGEDERVWFKVTGTHTIYLTGNYVEPVDSRSGIYDPDSDEEEEEYDLSPDEDELDGSEDESIDELDDLADPRITEVDEEEDAPALVKTEVKSTSLPGKGKNKRPAEGSEDEADAVVGAQSLDDMITEAKAAINGEEPKLSKKQRKKLKKEQDAAAVAAPVVAKVEEKVEVKKDSDAPSSSKSDKKVSFAKELEQGPTPTKTDKPAEKPAASKSPSLGVKTVQGVKLDDRKLGSGVSAKNGDRVSMRYIGKLESGKIFDSNKKGKPLSFKIGTGDVVKGMEIGVQGMQAGSERRITIPGHLAYGSSAKPGIPPNSTLIFDIKLLDINKGK